MIMWYWSADTLFWKLSIDHNMAGQYQYRRHAYASMSNTASHDNHEKNQPKGLLNTFLYEYGAQLWDPLGCQSSTKKPRLTNAQQWQPT